MPSDLMLAVRPSPVREPASRAVPGGADHAAPATSGAGGVSRTVSFGDLLARLAGKRPSRSADEAAEAVAPGNRSAVEEPVASDAAAMLAPAMAFVTPVVRLPDTTAGMAGDTAGVVRGPAGETPDDAGGTPEAVASAVVAAGAQRPAPAPPDAAETSPRPLASVAGPDLPAPSVPGTATVRVTPAAGQDSPDARPKAPPASAQQTEPGAAALADGMHATSYVQPSKVSARLDVPVIPETAFRWVFRSVPVASGYADEPDAVPAGAGTEVLKSIAERGPAATPGSDTQAVTAHRLDAYLRGALEPARHAGEWQVAPVIAPMATTVRGESGPPAEGPSALGPGPADSDASTTALLSVTGLPSSPPGAGTPAGPPAEVPAEAHVVVPQIVKAIRLQWKQGLGEARIRLEPEHLGEVQVSLRVQAGAVTAVVTAENPTVQGWIETRQQELKNALGEQGLRLQRFEVVVDPEGRRQSGDAPQDPTPRRQRRDPAVVPEFEVQV